MSTSQDHPDDRPLPSDCHGQKEERKGSIAKSVTMGARRSAHEREKPLPLIDVQVVNVELMSATDIVYTIVGSSTLSHYTGEAMTVQRRMGDFQWLHRQLKATYPCSLVPPLPPPLSSLRSLDPSLRYRLLENARRGLERFLHRVVAHPLLHESEWLQVFLEVSSPSEFKSHKSQPAKAEQPTLTGSRPVSLDEESDPWFIQKYRYFSALHDALYQLVGCARRVTQHHQQADGVHQPFAQSLQAMGDLHTDLCDNALNDRTCPPWEQMSQAFQQIGECENEWTRVSSFEFVDILNDFAELCGTVLTMFRRRSALRFAVIKNPQAEEPQHHFETYSQLIREEIEYFELSKTLELWNAMMKFVQASLHRSVLMKHQWQQLSAGREEHKNEFL